jgi:hypothetical protein
MCWTASTPSRGRRQGLRRLGVLGGIGESRVNAVKNTHIRQFLERHLKTADQVTR